MIAAVASGKGGTGKTTLAVNLVRCAAGRVQLLDCDVEEPNAHLYLKPVIERREPVYLSVPVLDPARCTGCGLCSRICRYNAIAATGHLPLIFPNLCHGCGGCLLVCPENALLESASEIGVLEHGTAGDCALVQGALHVGRALAPPVIRAVRRAAATDLPTVIDCPPGTSCSLQASIEGCDVVLLVAEPTRFSLHDLELLVEAIRPLGIPMCAVENRAVSGERRLLDYCRQEGIEILWHLPDDERYALAGSRGELLVDAFPELREDFERLWGEMERVARGGSRPATGGRHADLRV